MTNSSSYANLDSMAGKKVQGSLMIIKRPQRWYETQYMSRPLFWAFTTTILKDLPNARTGLWWMIWGFMELGYGFVVIYGYRDRLGFKGYKANLRLIYAEIKV